MDKTSRDEKRKMTDCEMCGYSEDRCEICPKCGFFMHKHEFDYFCVNKGTKYRFDTYYPFLSKNIRNTLFIGYGNYPTNDPFMHIKVQGHN